MLARMITGLLLKAGLSLGLLLGVASYAHYLSGGDPGALWSRVGGGAASGVADAFGGLRGRVAAPVAALGDAGSGDRSESVFTWRDEDGVVHYASAPPPGVDTTLVTVDPDVNVLAPVAAPAAAPRASSSRRSLSAAPSAAADGAGASVRAGSRGGRPAPDDGAEPLPGIAGAVLRARGDAPAPDPARAETLLKLLQAPTR